MSSGGYSTQPALAIANKVACEMLSRAFPFKFNRVTVAGQQTISFLTISWQADYALPGLSAVNNLAWVEKAWLIDINNTSQPKPIFPLEAVRDLERTSYQFGRPGQVCWEYNDQLVYGVWGGAINNSGQSNPGPNVVYTQPLGAITTPANPITQIRDGNNNLWVLTTFGTCGSTQPSWPTTPVYPTINSPSTVATTVADGACVWTAVNPKGQGFRLNPLPPQTGVVYEVDIIAQMKPPTFTTLGQTLEPIPDEFADVFMDGFVAHCYEHSADPKIRAKFKDQWGLWQASMAELFQMNDRERDNAGFYPDRGVVDGGGFANIGPAWPYGGF